MRACILDHNLEIITHLRNLSDIKEAESLLFNLRASITKEGEKIGAIITAGEGDPIWKTQYYNYFSDPKSENGYKKIKCD